MAGLLSYVAPSRHPGSALVRMDSQRKDRSDGPPVVCRSCRQGFPTQKRMMLENIALKTFPG